MNRETPLAVCMDRGEKARSLTAAGVLFIELMDATIILTALPSMAASFGVSANAMSIGVTAYAAAVAALIPASAWAVDRLGARRLLVLSLLGFVAASMLCAFAPSLEMFVLARVVQGASAAMMAPVARLMVMAGAERSQIMQTVAFLTWPALLAPLIAPPLGGWLTETLSWRWIFLINLPLGGFALAAVLLAFRSEVWAPRTRGLDVLGLVLVAAAGAGLVAGLDLAVRGEPIWAPTLVLSLGALGAFVFHARRTREPILNLEPLATHTFAVSAARSGALMRLAINATPYLLPLMFQATYHMGPTEAGGMLLIYMAGNIAMKPLTTGVLRRWSFRTVLTVNGLISAAAVSALAFTDESTPSIALYALLFVGGLARSMNFTATNTLVFGDVPVERRNEASTLASVLQQAMFSLGVGVAACLLATSMQARDAIEPAATDFSFALLVISALMVVSALGYRLSLPRLAGAAL